MIRGPNKILLTLEEVTFVHPSLSNKVSNICQDNAYTLIHDKCNKKSMFTISRHLCSKYLEMVDSEVLKLSTLVFCLI